MGYSREIYDQVQKDLYQLRVDAWEELERKKKLLYKRFPRVAEIQKEIASTAIESAKAVLNGSGAKRQLERLREKNNVLKTELAGILKSIDLSEDYLEVKYNCEKCCDEGFIDGKMCDCMKNMLRKECYKRLNNISPLELSSFENFDISYYPDVSTEASKRSARESMRRIFEYCKKYAEDFSKRSPSLLMMGNPGLGKTHLSLAIANEVIKKGYGVIYVSTQNMVTQMEKEKFQSYKSDGGSERHFIDCDLLIVDDLGTEYATAFSNASIYNVVNSRIMMGKPTIISTNLTIKELEKYYTPRTVSRIMGNNIKLEFCGLDIRQRRLRESLSR